MVYQWHLLFLLIAQLFSVAVLSCDCNNDDLEISEVLSDDAEYRSPKILQVYGYSDYMRPMICKKKVKEILIKCQEEKRCLRRQVESLKSWNKENMSSEICQEILASQTEELEKSHAKIDALEHLLKKCQDKLEDSVNGVSLEGISNDLKEKLEERDAMIDELKKQINDIKKELEAARKKAKQLKKSLTEKADLLAEKQEDYDAFKQKKDKIIEDLENKLNFTLSNEEKEFAEQIESLQKQLYSCENEHSSAKDELKDQSVENEKLKAKIAKLEDQLKDIKLSFELMEDENEKLKAELKAAEDKRKDELNKLKIKTEKTENELQAQINSLRAELNSTSQKETGCVPYPDGPNKRPESMKSCPPGWFGFKNACFKKIPNGKEVKTWSKAEEYCQQTSPVSSHLISIQNEEEEEFLKNEDVFKHMDHSWSGGYLSPDWEWCWTDGNSFPARIKARILQENVDKPEKNLLIHFGFYADQTIINWQDKPWQYGLENRKQYICKFYLS